MMSTDRTSLFPLYLSILAFALTFVLTPKPAQGQSDDLNIYGFFQTQYSYVDGELGGEDTGYGSFRLPQLNVYFAKDLGSNFSAFVSTEYLNTYNSGEDWGVARLGEGWVRYEHGQSLKVKGGLLIPKFNNLNEIKNRTPLLPYVTRPFVYEQSFSGLADLGDFVPQRAYLQVYGTLPNGDLKFDYAAYVGNSESEYIATGEPGSINVSGSDTTYTKLFGGRVGIRYQSLKVGVSGTVDEANLRQIDFFGSPIPVGLGDVDRYRLGADLSFEVAGFFVESEIISVKHSLTDEQETQWDAVKQGPAGAFLGEDLDQMFYYGVIGYNINSKIDIHVSYDRYIQDRLDAEIPSYGGGISYRPVFPVRLKAGYRHVEAQDGSFSQDTFNLAASITF